MFNNKLITAKVLFKNKISSISKMINEWVYFGIDQAFTLEDLFTDPLYQEEIKKTNIKTWIIIQTFLNIDKKDSLYAIKSDGSKAIGSGNGSWLHMICPNGGPEYTEENNYLKDLINRIKDHVMKYDPFGINLDFIRYFVFWEEVYESTDPKTLPQTCFCDRCLDLFCSETDIAFPQSLKKTQDKADFILKNYAKEWTNFKTDTITKVVKTIVNSVKEIKPGIKFNLHGVPWRLGEFENAIHRIAGQNYSALGNIVDGISPMCYTEMLKRDSSWINRVVADIGNQTNAIILPAFQGVSMYDSEKIDQKRFNNFIEESLKEPSGGIAFWPWEAISDENKNVIKEYFGI